MWAWLVTFLVVIVLIVWIGSNVRVIPEEQRSVVYRLGRFRRVGGPGLIFLWLGIESERRRFVSRTEPHTYRLDQVFSYGIPVGLTLGLWSRFDPKQAAAGNFQMLRDMILLDDEERHTQAFARVRQAVADELGTLEMLNPARHDASNLERITPVIPGSPYCSNLLRRVAARLTSDLQTLGIIFDPKQPITVTQLVVPQDLLGTFTRERIVPQLRQQFPNLPDDVLLQMVANIEGVAAPLATQRKHIMLETPEGTAGSHSYVLDDDAVVDLRKAPVARPGQDAAPDAVKPKSAPAGEHLSHEDLSVLRTFPP